MSDKICVAELLLVFALDGELFAIDAQMVREILEVPTITRVPGATPFVGGLMNVRGAIVPLADLAVSFGMDRAEHSQDTRVIVIETCVEGEQTTIGILADKVHNVAGSEGMEIDHAPPVGMRWRADMILGVARSGSQFLILPDLDRLLADELRQCAALAAAA